MEKLDERFVSKINDLIKPKTISDKIMSMPLIINDYYKTVSVWDTEQQKYIDLTFEILEYIIEILQSPVKQEGVIYIE